MKYVKYERTSDKSKFITKLSSLNIPDADVLRFGMINCFKLSHSSISCLHE